MAVSVAWSIVLTTPNPAGPSSTDSTFARTSATNIMRSWMAPMEISTRDIRPADGYAAPSTIPREAL